LGTTATFPPPLIVVLVLRCTGYLSTLLLASLLVALGYDLTVVVGFVAAIVAAGAVAGYPLTAGLLDHHRSIQ
jgi:hypothetical protein